MKLTPQQQRVFNYLKKHGSINPLESFMELSVYRLSDVIFKLRSEHNIDIKTKMTTSLNKYKEKCTFATYELKEIR